MSRKRSPRWCRRATPLSPLRALRKPLMLLTLLTAIAALTGYVIGWALEGETTDSVPLWSRAGLAIAVLMAAVSVGWSLLSLAFGDRLVLAMANAKEIDKADAPQ